MAAAATPETVKIRINDIELDVPKGELIVESVKRIGSEIPIFCYHPRMKPVGMCRMCLVEVGTLQPDGSVRKMPKPQAACTLPADNNMVIYTDTEMVHRDRKGVLEFLLINHPLDCPVCDRGGECPLQNNTIFYGPSTSRFIESKRHAPKAFPLSKYVTLDLERCIQCGRCVRFTEEISGDAQLAFRFRGASMQPSTFELTDFESKFSGNVIEICPVGALTNSKYRFRARPWDLETKPATCLECANHCSIWFDYRAGKFVRVNGRTNEAVNEEWTCDRGKFGHDWYSDSTRLTTPLIRRGSNFEPCTWGEAYNAIAEAFASGGNSVAGLAGGKVSNEGLFLFQRLFRSLFKSNNLDSRWTQSLQSVDDRLEQKLGLPQVRTKIAELEGAPRILVLGTSLADEAPMVYLRVRKAAVRYGAQVVVAHAETSESDDFASTTLHYRPGTEHILAAGLLRGLADRGKSVDGDWSAYGLDAVCEQCDVTGPQFQALLDLLAEPTIIVTTHGLLDDPNGLTTLYRLGQIAKLTGSHFNCYARHGNDQGAEEIGVLPDRLPGGIPIAAAERGVGTHQILEDAIDAKIQALWLLDCDPLAEPATADRAMLALETVPFLVVQASLENEAMAYASVVLPLEAPAEQSGTYTNIERRVQAMTQIIPTPGDAKQAWQVFSEILLRENTSVPFFNVREIMAEMQKEVPAFADYADPGTIHSNAFPAEPVSSPVFDTPSV